MIIGYLGMGVVRRMCERCGLLDEMVITDEDYDTLKAELDSIKLENPQREDEAAFDYYLRLNNIIHNISSKPSSDESIDFLLKWRTNG